MSKHTIVCSLIVLTGAACGGDGGAGPTGPGGGMPTRLAFLAPPADAALTAPLTPAARVAIQDNAGNTVTSATATIEISLSANPGGATLSGTATRDAVDGVATFDDLVIDRSGDGFALTASAPGLASATSASFEVAFLVDGLAAGFGHSCAVARGGDAYCWGYNYDGQLGNGEGGPNLLETRPQLVEGGLTFESVGTGTDHSCGLTSAGAAYCWGSDHSGQLGDGGSMGGGSHVPVAVAGGITFTALAIRHDHSCGLADDGAAYCWGRNGGQLGDGTDEDRASPVPVQGGLVFEALVAGGAVNCGLTGDGRAYCWGFNGSGAVGDGTQDDRSNPTAVAGGLRFTVLAAGTSHICGVTAGGSTYCWGSGSGGRLGTGSETNRPTPTAVAGGLSLVQLAAGERHTCGLTAAGAAHCWGQNNQGQLGDGGASNPQSAVPVPVSGGLAFAGLWAGDDHTCAMTVRGDPYCWGSDKLGRLGNGPPEGDDALAPGRVSDPEP